MLSAFYNKVIQVSPANSCRSLSCTRLTSGVYRVGRRPDGEEDCKTTQREKPSCKAKTAESANNLQSAPHSAASARSVKCKERSTRPSRTIWCEPCRTAAGWRGGLLNLLKGKALLRGEDGQVGQQLAECTAFGRPLQGV
jgi:hypothetical protein